MERWKEHFRDLLNVEGELDLSVLDNLTPRQILIELDDEISMEELEVAIKSMSADKATGGL